MQSRIDEYDLRTSAGKEIFADSAGTGSWHVGSAPDPRSIAVAAKHGIDIRSQRGRQISIDDFHGFDFILAMDEDNLRDLKDISPDQYHDRIHLLMRFASNSRIREVPDPFHFRDEAGFERIFSTLEEGVDGLIKHLSDAGLITSGASKIT